MRSSKWPPCGRRWSLGIGALLLSLLTAACIGIEDGGSEVVGADGQTQSEDAEVARTTMVPSMRPSSAEELGIALDDFGRPYDNYVGPQGTTTEERLLGRLTIDRGRFYLMGGESFLTTSGVASADKTTINFRGETEFDIRVIWQRPAGPEDEPVETMLGVRVIVRDKTVATWGPFKDGYTTVTGLGGVISRTSFEYGRDELEPDQPLLEDGLREGRSFRLFDLTGEPGRDLFLFDNGSGPGSYAYSEGFDEDGRLVAVMIWHPRYPWRLAVPDGEPPPDVTEREDQLQGCIDGTRTIDRWGRCT
ncbi:MAG: hypothetical protein AAGA65_08085 [Actinomycetota bacterium]